MKALRMSTARDLKAGRKKIEVERAAKDLLHKQACELVAQYPHCGPIRTAMWSVNKIGLKRCMEIASRNLSPYLFRREVAK